MLVQVSNKSTFLDLMQQDPLQIRDKLLAGLDRDYNVTNMGIVVEVIGELENFQITKEALEATRLGKHINELRRKSGDRTLASRAKSLVKKWRALLSAPSGESGPPPGGGNNNNIATATNGNARTHNARGASPGNQSLKSSVSPGLPLRSNLSPGLPLRSNLSPGLPNRSTLSPGLPPRSTVSPGLPPRSNVSPDLGPRCLVSPRTVSSSNRSPRHARGGLSPGLPPPDLSHVISSASTSPTQLSRPTSPLKGFSPLAPAEPGVEAAAHDPKLNCLVTAATKRTRPEDAEFEGSEPKRPRPQSVNHSLTNGGTYLGLEGAPASDNDSNLNRPRKARVTKSSERPDVLNKQMSVARRSGKVRTTQELVQNLGIESRSGPAPNKLSQSVNNLVPDENKMELMNRFFHSQEAGQDEVELTHSVDEDISRPSTATGATTMSSYSATPGVSRAPSPQLTTVEDVLAQLPPVDAKAVWAEWEANKSDEEEVEEVEGLIPELKQQMEITKTLVNDLNDGQLEHLGGICDYQGNFKEWHQLVSRETKDGDLLHILPYSVID